MSHVPHMDDSCHTYQWVVSCISVMYFPHINIMPHIQMRHATRVKFSCHAYERVDRLMLKDGLTKPCVRTLYQDCALIDLKLGVGPFFNRFKGLTQKPINVTNISISTKTFLKLDLKISLLLSWMSHVTCCKGSRVRGGAHVCFPVCAMTHLHVCHDSWYVCHDSFIRVLWLIHMCSMTHSYVYRDSFTSMPYVTVFSIRHHYQITTLCAWILPHDVLGRTNKTLSYFVHAPALAAPALFFSFPAYQCVWVCYYCVHVYTHTLARPGPGDNPPTCIPPPPHAHIYIGGNTASNRHPGQEHKRI